jgi:hypothetical protein
MTDSLQPFLASTTRLKKDCSLASPRYDLDLNLCVWGGGWSLRQGARIYNSRSEDYHADPAVPEFPEVWKNPYYLIGTGIGFLETIVPA